MVPPHQIIVRIPIAMPLGTTNPFPLSQIMKKMNTKLMTQDIQDKKPRAKKKKFKAKKKRWQIKVKLTAPYRSCRLWTRIGLTWYTVCPFQPSKSSNQSRGYLLILWFFLFFPSWTWRGRPLPIFLRPPRKPTCYNALSGRPKTAHSIILSLSLLVSQLLLSF